MAFLLNHLLGMQEISSPIFSENNNNNNNNSNNNNNNNKIAKIRLLQL